MPEYAGSLDAADEAYVYYNPQAVEAKRLPELSTEQVQAAFGNAEIRVFDNSAPLFSRLDEPLDDRAVVLLMSSGNFNNIDLKSWAELRTE
jgi:UDP-N-acetylmuramate: L-alanyl-gamma-D-glutamyl-meso-diaminopimelate ligase